MVIFIRILFKAVINSAKVNVLHRINIEFLIEDVYNLIFFVNLFYKLKEW